MPEWLLPVVSILGSIGGSYLGVKIAIARLEVQVAHIDGLMRAHDTAIDNLTARLLSVEGDLDRMKQDIGTHHSGLRGVSHAHAGFLTQHELRLHALDRQPLREL